MEQKRSIISALVGHVDHGKSSILDSIRKTNIVDKEAGKITQAIGASTIPLETIQKICKNITDQLKFKIEIPGILFIDTPGHAAFSNLRKRGGNIADIAILVIDINEGFKPQTIEAIQILKNYKTPFIIAANKIDLIPGWRTTKETLLKNINQQTEQVKRKLEEQTYEIVGKLSEYELDSDRYDRIQDLTQKIAIVPCSAKTQEGIAEILLMLAGIGQKYLEKKLTYEKETEAKGTVLEIKKHKGIGTAIDAIIYNGKINKNDKIAIGTLDKPVTTKIKTIYVPEHEADVRDQKTKMRQVDSAEAAAIVRIAATGIEDAVSGVPIKTYTKETEKQTIEEIQKEIEEVIIQTTKEGIIIKADTLGSLEALNLILNDEIQTQVMKAEIGNITKKDISTAEANATTNPENSVVLGFNIEAEEDAKKTAKEKNVKILTNQVIYQLIEDYKKWKHEQKEQLTKQKQSTLTKPCKIKILKGFVFRNNNPLIAGTEIIAGTLQIGTKVKTEKGSTIKIKEIQEKGTNIKEAKTGTKVAVSYEKATIGRQISEEVEYYSEITEDEFKKYKELKDEITEDEKTLLKEIAEIKRKENPLWGV